MQRRDFLRSSAALSSGLFLSSRGLARIAPQAPAELEVAVIGVGTQGLQLLKSCARIAGVRVRAVCDVWDFHRDRAVQRLEQQGLEVAAYEDHRALLDAEKSLDAAIVATPDFLHVPQAADCLERGLHVYCERPISNEVEAARRLVQAAARAGRQLQIGHQRRSNPRYIHCAEKLLGEIQLLGKIAAGSGQWNRSVDIDRGWPRRREIEPATLERIGFRSMQEFRNWRWYRRLGSGPFVEHGSDQIDVFHWFLGARPTAVYASGGTDYYDPESHEWPDTVLSIFEFRSLERPARVFYQTITTNGDYGHFEKLLGDEGTLMITESSGRVGVFREAAAPSWEKWVRLEYLAETEQPKAEEKDPEDLAALDVTETEKPTEYSVPVAIDDPQHQRHLENFFAAVRGEARLRCPGEIGLAALVSARKAMESAAAGGKVALEARDFAL